MEIKEFINTNLINMNLESTKKNDVIKELINMVVDNDLITDSEKVYQKALEREEKGTTGVGKGVAIPHVKSSAVKKPTVAFGRSNNGIDYGSMDEKPTYLFFLIVVPEESHDQHLKLLAQLSRKLIHDDFRESLMEAEKPEDIIYILEKS
ncbi:MAG: PTS sugar transporter subunit IIA [Bacillota bacterium]